LFEQAPRTEAKRFGFEARDQGNQRLWFWAGNHDAPFGRLAAPNVMGKAEVPDAV
jgi:hypothetical protein